jgi:predicted enzyme involved in methoxymalonyl-ACP biosynthesis
LLAAAKQHDVFIPEGYGHWVVYALDEKEELKSFAPDVIFLILDGMPCWKHATRWRRVLMKSTCSDIYRAMINNYTEGIIFISTIDILPKRITEYDAPPACVIWNSNGKSIV